MMLVSAEDAGKPVGAHRDTDPVEFFHYSCLYSATLEDGKIIDNANITHAYYNKAVPINEFMMKIEKKECAPTDMQRWLINDIAMVFDGGGGRSNTPMMDC